MQSEAERLKSFNDWPCPFINPRDLAKNGFYYTHTADVVRCTFCLVEICCWKNGDNAEEYHQAFAADCPFLCGLDVGNIPIETDQTKRFMSLLNECIDTELITLGISKHRAPVYPKYITLESRLKTFKNWKSHQNVKKLSEAGFFYVGKNDDTVCFSCGGGLRNWEHENDPIELHIKCFTKCSFINMLKKYRLSDDDGDDDGKIKSERICKICYVEEINVALLPCGHLTCRKCVVHLSKCFLCRKEISATVKIYLP